MMTEEAESVVVLELAAVSEVVVFVDLASGLAMDWIRQFFQARAVELVMDLIQ